MIGCQRKSSTLMSFFRLRLKQANMILRWPGLKPSTMLGMERSRSARENRISSCNAQGRQGSMHSPDHTGEGADDPHFCRGPTTAGLRWRMRPDVCQQNRMPNAGSTLLYYEHRASGGSTVPVSNCQTAQQRALWMKSLYGMRGARWSRNVPGTKLDSHALRSSTIFLLNAIWMASPSSAPARRLSRQPSEVDPAPAEGSGYEITHAPHPASCHHGTRGAGSRTQDASHADLAASPYVW